MVVLVVVGAPSWHPRRRQSTAEGRPDGRPRATRHGLGPGRGPRPRRAKSLRARACGRLWRWSLLVRLRGPRRWGRRPGDCAGPRDPRRRSSLTHAARGRRPASGGTGVLNVDPRARRVGRGTPALDHVRGRASRSASGSPSSSSTTANPITGVVNGWRAPRLRWDTRSVKALDGRRSPTTAISRPATPFEPLTLAPGEQLPLWLVQRASSVRRRPVLRSVDIPGRRRDIAERDRHSLVCPWRAAPRLAGAAVLRDNPVARRLRRRLGADLISRSYSGK